MSKTIRPFSLQTAEYVGTSNYFFDVIMPSLEPTSFMVLCFVFRSTVGRWEETVDATYAEISKATGIKSVNTIKKTLKQLQDSGYIPQPISLNKTTFRFGMNADFEIVLKDYPSKSDASVLPSKNDPSKNDAKEAICRQKMTDYPSKNDGNGDYTNINKKQEIQGNTDSCGSASSSPEPRLPDGDAEEQDQPQSLALFDGEDQEGEGDEDDSDGVEIPFRPAQWREGDPLPTRVTKNKKQWPKFCAFYQAYPKKENPWKTWLEWQNAKVSEGELQSILTDLEQRKKSDLWRNPRFVLYPERYLNRRTWEGEGFTNGNGGANGRASPKPKETEKEREKRLLENLRKQREAGTKNDRSSHPEA